MISRTFSHTKDSMIKTFALSGIGSNMKVTLDGSHDMVLQVDQPAPMGTGAAANPIETVMAGLLGCEQFTATLLSQKMGTSIDSIEWDLKSDLDLAGLMTGVYMQPFKTIQITAKVHGDIDDSQLQELGHQVHELCPVASMFSFLPDLDFEVNWIKM
eukprot:gnl/Dysnectes_brevis/770_a848_5766.p1 GENE.gnl/Dysnectes_brevis/770_a848_5766~~gnl/Dysnectes_brevis/770_a848_5766.p1  ORF type:complete len:157 (-),score=30.05 gnl/Dysnectes_brevis/770_a848_5766:61-531(-)